MRDVVIVGGGPAGLAAALVFGRSCKRAVVFDAGPPRNVAADRVRNFLTRDGIERDEFRETARAELARYPSIELRYARVTSIEKIGDAFLVHSELGSMKARKILLCAGVVDEVPDVVRALWGKTAFQCPYCHAWEVRGKRFAYWPRSADDVDHALLLRGWTKDLIVFPNGANVSDELRRDFAATGIAVDERRIAGVRAEGERLLAIRVEGAEVARDVLFVNPVQTPTPLVANLGLRMHDANSVEIDEKTETSIPGIHAAGDLTMTIQSALLAAASGMTAAYKINTLLTKTLVLEAGRVE